MDVLLEDPEVFLYPVMMAFLLFAGYAIYVWDRKKDYWDHLNRGEEAARDDWAYWLSQVRRYPGLQSLVDGDRGLQDALNSSDVDLRRLAIQYIVDHARRVDVMIEAGRTLPRSPSVKVNWLKEGF